MEARVKGRSRLRAATADSAGRHRPRLEALEDRTLLAVQAVSLAAPALLSDTAAGMVQGPASVSKDGRYAVYCDSAANLSPGQVMGPESSCNVFLFDRSSGATTLVSHAAGASTTTAHGASRNPVLSADGNWVAYVSNSDDLIANLNANGVQTLSTSFDVYLYNVQTGQNALVSHLAPDQGAGNQTTLGDGSSGVVPAVVANTATSTASVSISGTGQYIAYVSTATHLLNGQQTNSSAAPGAANVFVYDRAADTNFFISAETNAPTTSGDNTCFAATINQNGDTVAFTSSDSDLVAGQQGSGGSGTRPVLDFVAQRGATWAGVTTSLMSHSSASVTQEATSSTTDASDYPAPVITPDGHYVAYLSVQNNLVAGEGGGVGENVYLYDTTQTASATNNVLISHTPSGTAAAGNADTPVSGPTSPAPAISDNGQYVAFVSDATNLTSPNTSAGYNVFLFNRLAGDPTHNVTLITHRSVPQTDLPATSFPPLAPSISGDGQYVAYVGFAPADIGGLNNVNGTSGVDAVLYNTSGGTYTLLSHDYGSATRTGNASAYTPVLNEDGNAVFYLDNASNLIPTTVNGHPGNDLNAASPGGGTDLFAFSLATPGGYVPVAANGTNATVTLRDPNLPSLNGNGMSAIAPTHAVSDDGRFVVFFSSAPNLVPGEVDSSLTLNVYLYDANTQTTTLLSHTSDSATTTGDGASTNAVISGDGKSIVFYSFATNLTGATIPGGTVQLYLYDNNPASDTYQELRLISHTPGGSQAVNGTLPGSPTGPNGDSALLYSNNLLGQGLALPGISADGRYIAYLSNATNLVNSSGANVNVFLYDNNPRDSAFGKNALVSAGNNGTAANGNADTVALSGDGSTVAFTDNATNLLPGAISNGGNDELYVWSRTALVLKLASHAASDTNDGPPTAAHVTQTSSWGPLPPALDYSGNIIVYSLGATNLVAGQTGPASAENVFLYVDNNENNSSTVGTNTLVSHAFDNAVQAGDDPTNSNLREAGGPVISSDGRYVAYANNSTNLLSSPFTGQNGQDNVYLFDTTTGVNTLVSHVAGAPNTPDANGGTAPAMTPEGRYVTFVDLSLGASLTAAQLSYVFTPPGNVRLYDSQAPAGAQPVVVGGAFDPIPALAIGATLAPTAVVNGVNGPVVAWDGPAAGVAPVPGDRNGNLDVFLSAVVPITGVPPTDITLNLAGSIPLSTATAAGTAVGTLVASPTDTTYTYALVPPASGTNNNNSFTLDGNTGVLRTAVTLSVSTATNYTITVQATNPANSSLFFVKTFTIPVYPGITDLSLTAAVVPLSTTSPVGTTAGTLSPADPNPGQSFTFTVLTNANLFSVDATGTLKTAGSLEHGSTSVQVQVMDTLGLTFTGTFPLTVYQPITDMTLTPATPPLTTTSAAGSAAGTLSPSDPNPGTSFTYGLSGAGTALFTVDNSSGTLKTVASIAAPGPVSLGVQVTDAVGVAFFKTLTVTVNPAPPTDLTLSNDSGTAAQPAGTAIGTLSAADPNAGATFTYQVLTNAGLFAISGDSLVTDTVFAVGAATPYTVQVQVTDSYGQTFSKLFTITVNPAPPTDLTLSNLTVAAAQPVGAAVGTLSATDPNAGQSFTYQLLTGGAQFAISGSDLVTNAVFAVGAATPFTAQIQVTDSLGLTFAKTFILTVNPAPPTAVSLSGAAVAPGQPVGTVVGTLSTTDPNAGQGFTYSLTGPDAALFAVDNATGTLRTAATFTTGGTLHLGVQVTDTLGLHLAAAQPFAITVYAPLTGLALIPAAAPLTTASAAGAAVGTFSTLDPNGATPLAYTLSGPNAALFTVDSATGILTTAAALTTPGGVSLDVRVADALGLTLSATFTIPVSPATPTDLTLSNDSVAAAQPSGTAIGTLSAADPNAGATFTYQVLTNTGLFAISGDSLVTDTVFAVGAATPYTAQVQVTDSYGQTLSKLFTITVNPAPPTDISLNNVSVAAAQSSGAVVGTFSATDPNAGQSFTYQLLSGGGQFAVSGGSLVTNTVFAVGAATPFTAQIQVTDSLGLTFAKTFTITVNPAPPTDISLDNVSLAAAQPSGTFVGTLSATDPNAGQAFTYQLLTGGAQFAVSGSSLVTSTVLAVGAATPYTAQVQVTDSLGLTFAKTFIITVNPAPPTDIGLDNAFVAAAQPAGTIVGTLSTADPNAGQAFTYALPANLNPSPDPFAISGDRLVTNTVFAVGAATPYTVQVEATDALGLAITRALTITVNPAPPTDIALSNVAVAAAQPSGAVVGTLSATDPNAGQSFTYQLLSGGAQFAISGGSLVTSTVFAVGAATPFTAQVQVTDSLGLAFAKTFTLTVSPAPPTDIALSNVSLAAAQPSGTFVGTLSATDPNAGQSFTYQLLTGGAQFAVSGSSLVTSTVLAVGAATPYTAQVQVTDALGLTFARIFTLTVNPAPPTDIILSSAAVAPGQPVGTVVGTLSTTDPNAGQGFTYSLSGPDAALFAVDNATGTLRTAATFTTGGTLHLGVQVTDTLGLHLAAAQPFAITVYAPLTGLALSPAAAPLTTASAAGAAVGTLTAADPNGATPLAYSLSGPNAALFTVDEASGALTTAAALTTPGGVSLDVRVADALGLTLAATFTIPVSPAAPTDLTLSNVTLAAAQPSGTAIGTLSAADPNTGATFTYQVLTNAGLFAISGDRLVTNTVFAVGAATPYTAQVQVTDSYGQMLSKLFTITVNPAPPTDISMDNISVTAAQPAGTVVGTLSATDPNAGQAFTYQLLTGGTQFAISGSDLVTNTVFAVGAATPFTAQVQVTDSLGLTFAKTFTLTVNPAPPTDISLDNVSVTAAQPMGTVVGTLSAADPNAGQSFTYQLLTGGAQFAVSGGSLVTNAVFAVGAATPYPVQVQVSDALGLTFAKTFTLTVNPAPPTDISLDNDSVTAAQPSGTVIGTLSATDPNAGQSFTYQLLTGGAQFAVSGSSLVTSTVFAVGAATPYTAQVQVTDALGLTFARIFTLTVNPAPPTAVSLSGAAVAPGQPVGTVVGTLSTTDPNAGQGFTYSLGGPDAALFAVDNATGTLRTAATFAAGGTLHLGVQVTDTLGLHLAAAQPFAITVYAPLTGLALSPAAAPLTTAAAAGAAVGTFTATDPNGATPLAYTLSGPNAGLFTVDGATGALTTAAALTTPGGVSLDVRVADALGLTLSATFTIPVSPAAPTDLTLSNVTLAAAQPSGTAIGTLSAADPNAGATFTYQVLTNTGLFTVDGDSLVTKAVFAVGAATPYTAQVQVTDSYGQTFSKLFTITVNPAPPTDLTLSGMTVAAAQPVGTVVGTLGAVDPNAGQAFTYQLLSGGAQFAVSGGSLVTNTVFAVGAATPFTAQIQVTDALGLTFAKTFTITVNPAPPTDISLDNASVAAAQPAGTIVGTLNTADPNAGQAFTYALPANLNPSPDPFAISGDRLVTNTVFAVGAATPYTVQVEATDGLGLAITKALTITVNPAPPTDIALSNVAVAAAQPSGTVVGTLSATDPNAGQAFTYQLLSGGGQFAISGGSLVTSTVFAVAAATPFTAQVQVTDSLGLAFARIFTLTVSPTPPTDISLDNVSVAAAQPSGTVVGTLSATDPNAGQAFTYQLLTGGPQFAISGNRLVTNTVFAVGAATPYTTQVQVTDALGLTFARTFTLTVNPTPPTDLALSNSSITANQPAGTVLGMLSTSDPNPGQSFTYQVLTNANLFAISGAALVTNAVLTAAAPAAATYSVQVQTTDLLGLTFTRALTVTVNPVVLVSPNVVYVNPDWSGLPTGIDPDGPGGPARAFGPRGDAFATIPAADASVGESGKIVLEGGTYPQAASIVRAGILEFDGTVILDSGGDVALGATVAGLSAGGQNLVIDAGGGDVTFARDVGVPPLANLTINNARNVTFDGAVNLTGNLTINAATGRVTLNGGTVNGNVDVTAADVTLASATLRASSATLEASDAVVVASAATLSAAGAALLYGGLDNLGGSVVVDGTVIATHASLAGGAGNDRIVVDGTVQAATASVDAGAGDDSILLDATVSAAAVNLFGEGGNDAITVDRVTSPTTVDAGPGANRLTVDLSRTAAPQTVTVTSREIDSSALADPLNYLATGGTFANGVNVTSGAGNDVIDVQSTLAGAPTSVNAGGGDDEIFVASSMNLAAGTLDGMAGPLTVDAGPGANSLIVSDAGTFADTAVFMTSTAISVTNMPNPLIYRASGGNYNGSVIFTGAQGNDTYDILSVFPGAPTAIYGNGGNDSFNVGVTTSSDFRAVLLDGGAGLNVLGVWDLSGGAVVTNTSFGPSAGTVDVAYLGGTGTVASYQEMVAFLSNVDAEQSFIQGLYHRELGISATQEQIDQWLAVLNGPTGMAGVVDGIVRSQPALTRLVDGWYQQYLGRSPINGEEQGLVAQLMAGQPEELALSELLGQSEYVGLGGGTPAGFVERLFMQLFGRAPTPDELNAYANSVLPQAGYANTAWLVLTGVDYRRRVVMQDYAQMLGITALTPDEVDFWALSGLDLLTIHEVFDLNVGSAG